MAVTRPPTRPPRKPAPSTSGGPRLRLRWPASRWARYILVAFAGSFVIGVSTFIYLWISYGRIIDAKLSGEERPVPRIFGRAFEVRTGQVLSPAQLAQRLNDVGYSERPKPAAAGEFAHLGQSILVAPRTQASRQLQTLRVDFSKTSSPTVLKIVATTGAATDRMTVEAPLLAALAPGQRRRYVPLRSIPKTVINAVLAIEDRRFYDHPGVDPIGAMRALVTNLRGESRYLAGGSTLTQQIVKNTFLTRAQTYGRKLEEQFMALVLESRFNKDQILELYLNDQVFGQRGPFAIRGVGEASRIFFGKDVNNVTLAEAATMAGVLQSPSRLSPFRNGARALERRNVVLKEMADNGLAARADVETAMAAPLGVSMRALENEAPYFVDYVSQLVEEEYAGLLKDGAVDVFTTLDLHVQRIAQEAVGEGLRVVEKQLAGRKRQGRPQAALVAVDPRTGELLALVGGSGYNESQYNRAVVSRRQPGSVFKPFVYLAAFEKMAQEGSDDLTPATVMNDEPTVFKDGENDYAPGNYHNEYGGPMTLRRALALSRNVIAIKVAEAAGYDTVADLWKRTGLGTPAKPYPSIALGVFEVSPVEMAAAYTLFSNGGTMRSLQSITGILENNRTRTVPKLQTRSIARPDTTYLVTNMMRSVINEGTGASARGEGFTLDAAGKSGTTNDLRDAWFIGFTPELLTVVWVGFDNNEPLGLSGSQAALPIWTRFMKRALAGRPSRSFPVPEGVVFADIDKETGQLATAECPKVFREAFLAGTAPKQTCELHGPQGLIDRLGGLFRRIIR
jgi:penicillin-binding protein 1B